MSLLRQCSERHGTRDKVLHNALHRLHLVERDGLCSTLEVQQVAYEDGLCLLIGQPTIFLEFRIVTLTTSQLQSRYRLRIPRMAYSILAPVELAVVGEDIRGSVGATSADGIVGYLLQSDTTYRTHLRTEVSLQEVLTQTNALKNLRAAVAANGRDTHLCHHLEQSFLHRLDIVGLSRGVVFLYFSTLHEVVEDGIDHIRAECRGTITQQQSSVHRLTNLSTFHNQCCLHTFPNGDEIVVNGRNGKEGGDVTFSFLPQREGISGFVSQDDVVITIVHRFLSVLAEFVQRIPQTLPSLGGVWGGKRQRQFHSVEALVAYVAKYIELCVVQYWMRQSHHLTVALIGCQDARPHSADILCQTHDEILAYGVDSGVRHLCKLLTKIVEEQLWTGTQHRQRRIVTHGCQRLLSCQCHRYDGSINVFGTVAEELLTLSQVGHAVLYMSSALQFFQLDTVG